jgi:hypothetical protein
LVESEYRIVQGCKAKATTESLVLGLLRDHGGIMSTSELTKACYDLGVSGPAIWRCLCHSPLIQRIASRQYTYVGSQVSVASTGQSAGQQQTRQRVLQDYGIHSDGRIWIACRVTLNLIHSGVMGIPVALQRFATGRYELRDAEDRRIGNVTAEGSSAWGFTSFFRRRGGEPGDVLVAEFDHGAGTCVALLGDAESLDSYRSDELLKVKTADADS